MTYLSPEIVELAKSVGFYEKPNFGVEKMLDGVHPYIQWFYSLQQVEEWLWEKHEIALDSFTRFNPKSCIVNIWKNDRHIKNTKSDNPFTAREQGVRQALEHLRKEKI